MLVSCTSLPDEPVSSIGTQDCQTSAIHPAVNLDAVKEGRHQRTVLSIRVLRWGRWGCGGAGKGVVVDRRMGNFKLTANYVNNRVYRPQDEYVVGPSVWPAIHVWVEHGRATSRRCNSTLCSSVSCCRSR